MTPKKKYDMKPIIDLMDKSINKLNKLKKTYSKVNVIFIDGSEEVFTIEQCRIFAVKSRNIIHDMIPIYDNV